MRARRRMPPRYSGRVSDRPSRLTRFRALPGLLRAAPRWVTILAGVASLALGLLLVTRPLVSLSLLAVYAGVSCIVSGIAEFGRNAESRLPSWTRIVAGVGWILVGAALIICLG